MQLSVLSYAFLFFATISVVFGIVTGKTILFAITAGIIAIPSIYLFHYLGDVKKGIISLEFSRKTDAEIFRQNSDISVFARFTPENMLLSSVIFEDLLPVGGYLVHGSPVFQHGKAKYTFRLPTLGNVYFRGVRVTATTIFGTITFILSNAIEPKLSIYPIGIAALAISSETEYANKAKNRYAFIPSEEIRDFREYHDGDNLHDIDWKQTVHHDKLYIRLKADSHMNHPLLILDLPDYSASAKDVIAFTNAAESALIFCKEYNDASIVFISGGTIIKTLTLKDSEQISQILFTAGKQETAVHLYHERPKQDIAFWINQIQNTSSATPTYRTNLLKILQATLKRADGEFERQSRRLFQEKQNVDFALIISGALGDISNLLYLVHDASESLQGISIFLSEIDNKSDRDEITAKLRAAGASVVEVIS